MQKCNDVILLFIREAKISAGHVDVVLYFRHRPAVNFFGRSFRAMSGSDRIGILVARIVEMHELLQALNVAVVKEPLLEVRPGGFGGRTLWRCHCHVARRRHLHLAVDSRCVLPPTRVRGGTGTEPASEESPKSQISVAEPIRIGGESVSIRLGLVIEGVSRIEGQALIGRSKAREQRVHHGGGASVGLI